MNALTSILNPIPEDLYDTYDLEELPETIEQRCEAKDLNEFRTEIINLFKTSSFDLTSDNDAGINYDFYFKNIQAEEEVVEQLEAELIPLLKNILTERGFDEDYLINVYPDFSGFLAVTLVL